LVPGEFAGKRTFKGNLTNEAPSPDLSVSPKRDLMNSSGIDRQSNASRDEII
jgi:hypothetical protein